MLWRSGPTATQADGEVVTFRPLNVEDSDIPFPHVQHVADVEKLFLPVELQLVQGLRPRFPAEAVELESVKKSGVGHANLRFTEIKADSNVSLATVILRVLYSRQLDRIQTTIDSKRRFLADPRLLDALLTAPTT